MVTLNVFNGKRTANPTILDGKDYWKIYFNLLNVSRYELTVKDIEILSWIISRNDDVNYFYTPGSKELMEEIRCTSQEVSKLKKKFAALGILEDSGMLSQRILKLREVANREGIAFIFPMEIAKDDTTKQ